MYLQAFGEILTDALTVNPILETIPSASAILDASNYTFQAVTLGKDAQGYSKHAHTVSGSLVGGVANNGIVIVSSLEDTGTSSYSVTATHSILSSTYVSSLPNSPWTTDTRLERGDTSHPDLNGSLNLGHYTNHAISNDLAQIGDANPSAIWNVVGSFPPSGETATYMFVSANGVTAFSGTLSGYYNTYGLVDKNGYITINPTAQSSTDLPAFDEGSIVVSAAGSPQAAFFVKTRLMRGDAACLAAFGGVNHIGIYCIDMKAMLAAGLTPPYQWDALNNTRSYKLVAKVTTLNNMLKHVDCDSTGLGGIVHSGFERVLNKNEDILVASPGTTFFDILDGPTLTCAFQLK